MNIIQQERQWKRPIGWIKLTLTAYCGRNLRCWNAKNNNANLRPNQNKKYQKAQKKIETFLRSNAMMQSVGQFYCLGLFKSCLLLIERICGFSILSFDVVVFI